MNILKTSFFISIAIITAIIIFQCSKNNASSTGKECKILFLHHSTGAIIYKGGSSGILAQQEVPKWFNNYNKKNGTSYKITEQEFPKSQPYGWNNYPYDYYNIWVKHAGNQPYLEEPTLEMLTKEYNVIIFKHCFPGSNILEDLDNADIDSPEKRLGNYKLQYQALKQKLTQFPEVKFIVWTGAALIEAQTTPENAARAREFSEWVKNEWDTNGDNIYVWDFRELETEGGLYLKKEYASSSGDSHPGKDFAKTVAPLLCQRIVDVIENNGAKTTLTGKPL